MFLNNALIFLYNTKLSDCYATRYYLCLISFHRLYSFIFPFILKDFRKYIQRNYYRKAKRTAHLTVCSPFYLYEVLFVLILVEYMISDNNTGTTVISSEMCQTANVIKSLESRLCCFSTGWFDCILC